MLSGWVAGDASELSAESQTPGNEAVWIRQPVARQLLPAILKPGSVMVSLMPGSTLQSQKITRWR